MHSFEPEDFYHRPILPISCHLYDNRLRQSNRYVIICGIDKSRDAVCNVPIMNESSNSLSTRREFLKTTGRIAAASALAGVALPNGHAAGTDLIQVALIDCGGRGTGAAENALRTTS